MNTTESLSPYQIWEAQVTTILTDLLQCSPSDAQGTLEAHSFEASQGWGRDLTPFQTAEYIISKL